MINHKGTVTLETQNLILRKFAPQDADSAFKNFVSDKSVTKYLRWYNIHTLEDMKLFIDKWMQAYNDSTYYWAIELKESNEVVGSIGIVKKLSYGKLTNLYYCISRDYWGRGIAAEALNKILDFFFNEVGFEKSEILHPSNDLALGHTVEKAGLHLFDEIEFEEVPDNNPTNKKNMFEGEGVPLFFQPIFMNHLWGGKRIRQRYGFGSYSDIIAEYWAVSGVPGSESIIKNGKYRGQTLNALFKEHKELFGNIPGDIFPILVKIIDAEKDLSVQVHPGDDYANKNENGKFGKNECWYILESDDKDIIYGHTAKTREEFEEMVKKNQWDSLLENKKVQPDDFIMVENGKVHAIKSGVMVLEIQQASDVTYRLYDYDRVDDSGKKRELHIEKALDVVQYPDKPFEFEQKMEEVKGAQIITLVENNYFTVRKFKVKKELIYENTLPFMIICITKGGGRCNGFFVKEGSVFIVGSDVKKINIEGDLEFIEAHV